MFLDLFLLLLDSLGVDLEGLTNCQFRSIVDDRIADGYLAEVAHFLAVGCNVDHLGCGDDLVVAVVGNDYELVVLALLELLALDLLNVETQGLGRTQFLELVLLE